VSGGGASLHRTMYTKRGTGVELHSNYFKASFICNFGDER